MIRGHGWHMKSGTQSSLVSVLPPEKRDFMRGRFFRAVTSCLTDALNPDSPFPVTSAIPGSHDILRLPLKSKQLIFKAGILAFPFFSQSQIHWEMKTRWFTYCHHLNKFPEKTVMPFVNLHIHLGNQNVRNNSSELKIRVLSKRHGFSGPRSSEVPLDLSNNHPKSFFVVYTCNNSTQRMDSGDRPRWHHCQTPSLKS